MLSSYGFAQVSAAKVVGTVKSTSGNTLTLSPDAGTDTTVTIADSARILRTLPGQTDLKAATPISATDIQIGDRVFVRGQAGENGALLASSIIVMSKSDIAERQQQDREEWRKGVGGIVKSVDVTASTVTLANSLLASGKPIVVHVSQSTQVLRYAPDSTKFDDAKPGRLDEIKAGDQIRARGTKSSKKPVTVRVSSESQLHKLPPMVAQMIAFRLKGGVPGAQPGQATAQSSGGNSMPAGGQAWGGRVQGNGTERLGTGPQGNGGPAGAGGGNWRNGGGPPDFQQMLSRMPVVTIADLSKGDAVMLVVTQGSSANGPTAITMLVGVEPILSAAPPGTSAMTLLSPWNLGTSGGGGDMSTQ
ncbi:MAG: hypothetical protein DMG95_13885 [Acidobacteria bacterium]|nr:MAG: hypothetical protein DMG95_13885 [Acidobacteriota bacterium]